MEIMLAASSEMTSNRLSLVPIQGQENGRPAAFDFAEAGSFFQSHKFVSKPWFCNVSRVSPECAGGAEKNLRSQRYDNRLHGHHGQEHHATNFHDLVIEFTQERITTAQRERTIKPPPSHRLSLTGVAIRQRLCGTRVAPAGPASQTCSHTPAAAASRRPSRLKATH